MVTSGVSDEHKAAQFARCIRALLRNPMLDKSAGEVFTHVVEREQALQSWFSTHCDWTLRVDAEHGYARLFKEPVNTLLPRPLMAVRREPVVPFDRARYALTASWPLCCGSSREGRSRSRTSSAGWLTAPASTTAWTATPPMTSSERP
jgi:Protein of unknown function (DUF2398)